MEKKKKTFKWRGMTTFVLILSLIFETVSGIVLYIVPSGRIARWTGWTMWGLDKGEWQALHIIFGLVLLLIILAHLYFNWRVVAHFFWSKVKGAVNLKAELAVAGLITLFIFMGTLWNLPIFSSIIDFRQQAKHGWETNSPTGFGQGKGRWADRASSRRGNSPNLHYSRERKDNVVSSHDAENVSKYESFEYGRDSNINKRIRGKGLGRKTVEMICVEGGVSTEEGLLRLSEKGIQTNAGERVRDLAKRLGSRPNDVVLFLTGGKGISVMNARGRAELPTEKSTGCGDKTPGKLKGRDIVRLGKPGALSGILKKDGDEWILLADGKAYDLHMGPGSYRESRGFKMKDGNFAAVKGFLYGKDMAVSSLDTHGKVIVLRDDTGHPAWSRM